MSSRPRGPVARILGLTLSAALAGLSTGANAQARTDNSLQPLWEFGFGVGGLVLDDYRGAGTAHAYPVPLPYFVYRGHFLRSDREGVHGRFLHGSLVELDLSLSATPPVFSHSSLVRHGMPNLQSTVEVGPQLSWHLWHSPTERLQLDLRTALRSAITLAIPPRAIGWIFAPALNLDARGSGLAAGWRFGVLSGPLFADRRYDQYYYEVARQYATAVRPAYDPAGGYSGTELLLSASRHYRSYWIGAYLRHDWLQGAAFIVSPMVQQREYWAGGIAIVWILAASSSQVSGND